MSILTDRTDVNETNALPSHVEAPGEAENLTSKHSHADTPMVLSIEEIHQLLPHRYPFSLVDRIIEYVPGKRAVGIKNVTFNEPHFQGHFPGRPIMPGVLSCGSYGTGGRCGADPND
ncbi:hotdog family protein [Kovacikia minuta]|uniref:hypothetical protein n=1 Tax=Kovacikia minuta TaxID=2931930 RepID=UPI0036F29C73